MSQTILITSISKITHDYVIQVTLDSYDILLSYPNSSQPNKVGFSLFNNGTIKAKVDTSLSERFIYSMKREK